MVFTLPLPEGLSWKVLEFDWNYAANRTRLPQPDIPARIKKITICLLI
jgi:hypothetical protein